MQLIPLEIVHSSCAGKEISSDLMNCIYIQIIFSFFYVVLFFNLKLRRLLWRPAEISCVNKLFQLCSSRWFSRQFLQSNMFQNWLLGSRGQRRPIVSLCSGKREPQKSSLRPALTISCSFNSWSFKPLQTAPNIILLNALKKCCNG